MNKETFLRTGVALHPDRGTALENALYNREMLPAGSTFKWEAVWFGEMGADFENTMAVIAEGLRAGAATSSGNGRLILDLTGFTIIEDAISDDGVPAKRTYGKKETQEIVARIRAARPEMRKSWASYDLELSCDGAFISKRKLEDEGREGKTVVPLEYDEKPVLWPESLKGALRARARWLEEVERLRGNSVLQRDRNLPMDDPKLEHVLGTRHSPRISDLPRLSAVERLFGVTGLRASLEISHLKCAHPGVPETLTMVAIDRISGGGRDGLLYSERVYWGCRFTARLHVPDKLEDDEESLVARLIANLTSEGIELGHGSAKGYGWFDVTCKKTSDKGDF